MPLRRCYRLPFVCCPFYTHQLQFCLRHDCKLSSEHIMRYSRGDNSLFVIEATCLNACLNARIKQFILISLGKPTAKRYGQRTHHGT